jgi:predicted dehydrogenase
MRHRLGLLGAQAHYHYVTWFRDHPRCDLAGLCEDDPRRREDAVERLGAPVVAAAELLDDPSVDLVFLASDPADKADWVELAAAAGKHIMMDKPYPADLAALDRMARAVAAAGVTLVAPYPHGRFNANLAALLAQLEAGDFGRLDTWDHVFMFYTPAAAMGLTVTRPKPPGRATGGEALNIGCYAVDLLLAALGPPRRVLARVEGRYWREHREVGVEDYAEAWLEFEAARAHLTVGRNRALSHGFTAHRLRLAGPGMDIVLAPYEGLRRINGQPLPVVENESEGRRCCEHFLACAEGLETTLTGPEAGRAATELTIALYQSAAGGGWIDLPLSDPVNPYATGWRPA